jgi:hypothetical protein
MTRRRTPSHVGGVDLLPDGRPDPCPDYRTVVRELDGVFLIKHYPHGSALEPCCVDRIVRSPGESDTDALARGDRECDRRHEGTAVLRAAAGDGAR